MPAVVIAVVSFLSGTLGGWWLTMVVVTASISSLRGAHSLGAYCASKFAVMGLVESLAKEVAGRGILRRMTDSGH